MRPSDARPLRRGNSKAAVFMAALLLVISLVPAAPVWAAHSSTNQQALHDVAVTDIHSSSLSVLQGEIVSIDATVQNLGTESELALVSLRDDTDSGEIAAISLALDSNQSLTTGFQWDTSRASSGPHSLSAVVTITGDQDTSNNSLTLASPINVNAPAVILGDGTDLDLPDAFFGAAFQPASITTQSSPATSIFIGKHDASLSGSLVQADVTTQSSPIQSVFVANADAIFQPTTSLQDPFGQGNPSGQVEVEGTVHLEGNPSSLGGYVQVGPDTHFVDSNGDFRFSAPSGSLDILIKAPGYVPVRVTNAQVSPGAVLTLPSITLPFGDGKIDILDLSISASNFGETVAEVAPP